MQIVPVYAGLHKQICSLEAWEILQEILRNFPCVFFVFAYNKSAKQSYCRIVCNLYRDIQAQGGARVMMWFVGLLAFTLGATFLMGRRSAEQREMDSMDELNRCEYHHVYPVSD